MKIIDGGEYLTKQLIQLLIGGILSLTIAMGIGRFAYTPILPLMQNDVVFSDAVAGFLATSNYAGYLFGSISSSLIPLKQRPTTFLRVSLVISVLTTAFMGLTFSYFIWYILRFISGFASAFVFVLSSSIVLDKLAKRGKSSWSGLFYSGVGFGIFFSSLIIPVLNKFYMWEGTWLGLATVSGIIIIFIWIWLKATNHRGVKRNSQQVLIQTPPKKWLTWLIVAYGLEGLGYIVTGTFIVSFAEKAATFSSGASLVWMIVGLAAIPSCIIWSMLAPKLGFVKSLVIAFALQSIGIAMPVIWISDVTLIVSALLFGATFMGITTLATTLARQISPYNSNQIIGYMTAIYAIGQIIGPSIAGILSTHTSNFNAALLCSAGVVLLGALLLLTGIKYEQKNKCENCIQNIKI